MLSSEYPCPIPGWLDEMVYIKELPNTKQSHGEDDNNGDWQDEDITMGMLDNLSKHRVLNHNLPQNDLSDAKYFRRITLEVQSDGSGQDPAGDDVLPAIFSNSLEAGPLGTAAISTLSTIATCVQDEKAIQEPYTPLFCRTLYDHDTASDSEISFQKDNLIEILTQRPSGWWDGLLGEERGWFPSNHATMISCEEAELAFSQSKFSTADDQVSAVQPNPIVKISSP